MIRTPHGSAAPQSSPPAKMPTAETASAAQMARGIILLLLAQAHPYSVGERILRDELLGSGEETSGRWSSHLAYLEERGYIEIEKKTIAGAELRKFRATADGLLIAEREREDLGVYLPPRPER